MENSHEIGYNIISPHLILANLSMTMKCQKISPDHKCVKTVIAFKIMTRTNEHNCA